MPTSHLRSATAPTSRRGFFKRAGLGLGVATAVVSLQACDSDSDDDSEVVLDFSTDAGILNFAYALEQLEAAFYTQVAASSTFEATFPDESERQVIRDLRDHEVTHAAFLAAVLQDDAISNLTTDFSSVDLADRSAVLAAARTFEDLGVGAYNGAGKYITTPDYLTVAGKIVSVEARHASAIRRLRDARGFAELEGWIEQDNGGLPQAAAIYQGESTTTQAGVNLAAVTSGIDSSTLAAAFDEPLTMEQVLNIAGPFLPS